MATQRPTIRCPQRSPVIPGLARTRMIASLVVLAGLAVPAFADNPPAGTFVWATQANGFPVIGDASDPANWRIADGNGGLMPASTPPSASSSVWLAGTSGFPASPSNIFFNQPMTFAKLDWFGNKLELNSTLTVRGEGTWNGPTYAVANAGGSLIIDENAGVRVDHSFAGVGSVYNALYLFRGTQGSDEWVLQNRGTVTAREEPDGVETGGFITLQDSLRMVNGEARRYGARMLNASTGTIDLNGLDIGVNVDYSTPGTVAERAMIRNDGLLRMGAANRTSNVDALVENTATGRIVVNAGELSLRGGGASTGLIRVESGARLSLDGSHSWTGDTTLDIRGTLYFGTSQQVSRALTLSANGYRTFEGQVILEDLNAGNSTLDDSSEGRPLYDRLFVDAPASSGQPGDDIYAASFKNLDLRVGSLDGTGSILVRAGDTIRMSTRDRTSIRGSGFVDITPGGSLILERSTDFFFDESLIAGAKTVRINGGSLTGSLIGGNSTRLRLAMSDTAKIVYNSGQFLNSATDGFLVLGLHPFNSTVNGVVQNPTIEHNAPLVINQPIGASTFFDRVTFHQRGSLLVEEGRTLDIRRGRYLQDGDVYLPLGQIHHEAEFGVPANVTNSVMNGNIKGFTQFQSGANQRANIIADYLTVTGSVSPGNNSTSGSTALLYIDTGSRSGRDVRNSPDGLTFAATSSLNIQLGGRGHGTDYDTLLVRGAVRLEGNLNVTFTDGFAAGVTQRDVFAIVSDAWVFGQPGLFSPDVLFRGTFANLPGGSGSRMRSADGLFEFTVTFGVPGFIEDPSGILFTTQDSIILHNFVAVPTPGTLALLGIAGLTALRRRHA